ncbi:hypothetical protein C8Q79DRAFT_961271 [Trametes meyenii]|nr:hypothetical protein C8Q79DRAFT_961271 [Trametes meyenii]
MKKTGAGSRRRGKDGDSFRSPSIKGLRYPGACAAGLAGGPSGIRYAKGCREMEMKNARMEGGCSPEWKGGWRCRTDVASGQRQGDRA